MWAVGLYTQSHRWGLAVYVCESDVLQTLCSHIVPSSLLPECKENWCVLNFSISFALQTGCLAMLDKSCIDIVFVFLNIVFGSIA